MTTVGGFGRVAHLVHSRVCPMESPARPYARLRSQGAQAEWRWRWWGCLVAHNRVAIDNEAVGPVQHEDVFGCQNSEREGDRSYAVLLSYISRIPHGCDGRSTLSDFSSVASVPRAREIKHEYVITRTCGWRDCRPVSPFIKTT